MSSVSHVCEPKLLLVSVLRSWRVTVSEIIVDDCRTPKGFFPLMGSETVAPFSFEVVLV